MRDTRISMGKLILIRHGEAQEDGDDILLSETGKKQAKELAKRLSTMHLDLVYASDYRRAAQTYQAFHDLKPDVPAIFSPKVREIYRVIIGGPEREGTPSDRAQEDRKRADDIYEEITKLTKTGKNVVMFCHGNIIRYFIAKALQLPKEQLWKEMPIDNASVTVIEITSKQATLKILNSTDHLDSHPRKKLRMKPQL